MSVEKKAGSAWTEFLIAMVVIGAVLGFLFRESFTPEKVLFSNDAPLGLISSKAAYEASTFNGIVTGFWQDLNWIGIEMPSVLPGLSWAMYQVFGGPVANAKFHVPLSFLFLGLAAWGLFRTLGFRPAVCVIGGLAAALNMNPFSHGTWGLPSRALSWGAALLAVAALYSSIRGRAWIKASLAGMCVGFGIVEGFDVGALYSLYIAAFALFIVLAAPAPEGKPVGTGARLAKGGILVAVVAISAGLFAAQALSTLISTQITGVAQAKQDAEGKPGAEAKAAGRWTWTEATAWSLPPAETLRVLVPGLFGYRMDSPEGGNYWGRVGEQPGLPRHSGAGEYAGILVVLVAIFGLVNALRKKGQPFGVLERRMVLFWTGAAMVSVLFAWGHWAPFYQVLFKLPFFSTIRNPIKFMHYFHLSLLIVFGYGLDLLFRNYVERANAKGLGMMEGFKEWFATAGSFERKVVYGFSAGLAVSLVAFLMYTSATNDIKKHLVGVGFPEGMAAQVAAFSQGEVGLYLLFYVLAFAAVLLCLSGYFSGKRARVAGLVLGALLVIDLARANKPWIVYLDYKDKYVSNGVLDFLRKDPVEHRVTYHVGPFLGESLLLSPQMGFMGNVFSDWLQHQFQMFNIQTLDIIQFPRPPALDNAYWRAFVPANNELYRATRLWELSNTRYILGQKEFIGDLNTRFDPELKRFRIATNFDYTLKPGVDPSGQVGMKDLTWELKPNGNLAIFEFTGALPRYKLYGSWQATTNDAAALAQLASKDFDPQTMLFVHDAAVAASPAPAAAGTNSVGAATLVNYEPKKIQLKTDAAGDSILLWNDRWSPNWKAFVDGQPVALLRCNYLMRGIPVPKGSHTVEMRYEQPAKLLGVSFATMALGILFCGLLAFTSGGGKPSTVGAAKN
jgi:hypothetical protein